MAPSAAAFKFQAAPPAQVKQLQTALRASGAKDARGRLPAVTGKLDDSTVEATQTWNALVMGTNSPLLNRTMILANLTGIINQIATHNVPHETQAARPQASMPSASVVSTIKPLPANVGPFACMAGTCRPINEEAKQRAIALQWAINRLPAKARGGAPLTQSGIIDAATLRAYRNAVTASAARNHTTPAPRAADLTTEWIASNLGVAINAITRDLAAVTQPAQVPTPKSPPGTPANVPVFQIQHSGAATGNAIFRCAAMALQVQLNRLGQRLVVDGTIGENTRKSLEALEKKPWTIREIAESVMDLAKNISALADNHGAPAPPASVFAMAKAKCALETGSPLVDARYFAAGPVSVPTAAPPPTRTPTDMQPLPVPPSPKVRQLQGLLNTFPAEIVALYPGGKPVAVTGILNDNDVGAMRAVLYANQQQKGGDGSGVATSAIAALTVFSVNQKLDDAIFAIRTSLTLAQQVYGPETVSVPATMPQQSVLAPGGVPEIQTTPSTIETSNTGLMYQITPNGIVGVGPNAGAFTGKVRELQQQIARLIQAAGTVATSSNEGPATDFSGLGRPRGGHRGRGGRGYRGGGGFVVVPSYEPEVVFVPEPACPPGYVKLVGGYCAPSDQPLPPGAQLAGGPHNWYYQQASAFGAAKAKVARPAAPRAVRARGGSGAGVTGGGSMQANGVLDAATVGAFNAYVVPRMTEVAVYTAPALAKDIDNVVNLARVAADVAVHKAGILSSQQAAERQSSQLGPMQSEQRTTAMPEQRITAEAAQQIQQQAVAQGLAPEEATAITEAAQSQGKSVSEAQAMVDAAAEGRPGMVAAAAERKSFPWGLVLGGLTAASAVGGLAYKIHSDRKAHRGSSRAR